MKPILYIELIELYILPKKTPNFLIKVLVDLFPKKNPENNNVNSNLGWGGSRRLHWRHGPRFARRSTVRLGCRVRRSTVGLGRSVGRSAVRLGCSFWGRVVKPSGRVGHNLKGGTIAIIIPQLIKRRK